MSETVNTQGTEGRNLTEVLPDRTFEDDRRKLIAKRVIDGANTPDGHTYSNILELRENWEKVRPGDFAMQHLPRLMEVQAKRLEAKRPDANQ